MSESWNREQIEKVWDVFSERGLDVDRAAMYYDEGADSEFCEAHRRYLAETLDRAGLASTPHATEHETPHAAA